MESPIHPTPHEPYEGMQEYPAALCDWDDLMSQLCDAKSPSTPLSIQEEEEEQTL
jgi:hypothetical protein